MGDGEEGGFEVDGPQMEFRTEEIRQLLPSPGLSITVVAQINGRRGEWLLIRDDDANLRGERRYSIVGWSWETAHMSGGRWVHRGRSMRAAHYVRRARYSPQRALVKWSRLWQDEEANRGIFTRQEEPGEAWLRQYDAERAAEEAQDE